MVADTYHCVNVAQGFLVTIKQDQDWNESHVGFIKKLMGILGNPLWEDLLQEIKLERLMEISFDVFKFLVCIIRLILIFIGLQVRQDNVLGSAPETIVDACR